MCSSTKDLVTLNLGKEAGTGEGSQGRSWPQPEPRMGLGRPVSSVDMKQCLKLPDPVLAHAAFSTVLRIDMRI